MGAEGSRGDCPRGNLGVPVMSGMYMYDGYDSSRWRLTDQDPSAPEGMKLPSQSPEDLAADGLWIRHSCVLRGQESSVEAVFV